MTRVWSRAGCWAQAWCVCLGAYALAAGVLAAHTGLVVAQSYRDVAPVPPPQEPHAALPAPLPATPDAARIAVAALRGLVFYPADQTPGHMPPALSTPVLAASGLPLLDAAFLHGFEADLGKPLNFERLAQIRRAVVQRYRAAGEPLVDVYLPEQDVSDGVVRIAVVVFRLGQVRARGNRYFSATLLQGEMPLVGGAPLSESAVASDLVLLNANPYRHVDVVYAPGIAQNSTDVLLQTEDRLPWRVDAGYDNNGVPQLGRERYSAGIDYGNLFGLDQQIAYQFTTSNDLLGTAPSLAGRPDRPRLMASAVNYVAPLPWQDKLEVFGVYAQSTPRLPDHYDQSGVSAQLSLRYDWLLPVLAGWQQQMQFGYDFKRSNNNLEFGGFQVFNADTHIQQFLLAYDALHPDALGLSHANLTWAVSPGGLDGDNNDTAFNAARFGAKSRYLYAQLSGQRDLTLSAGVSLMMRGLLQWTPNTLLPSEELGLGGDSSVRGYDPYVVQGDRGWNLQTELRAPSWSLGASSAALQAFAFVDAGHVWNRIDQPAELGNGALLSVGVGLRWQVARYVNAHVEVGKPLRAALPQGSTAPALQFALQIGS